ncbi:hypothetical protein ACVOMV_06535 [Mesorhizobium atlanticum]
MAALALMLKGYRSWRTSSPHQVSAKIDLIARRGDLVLLRRGQGARRHADRGDGSDRP